MDAKCWRKISNRNSWALDSTFSTNQYDLPLYVVIVPNPEGKWVPIFYILCTKNVKREQWQSHEGIALELALTIAFASMGNVRPSAIYIDRHRMSLNTIYEVVGKDIYCWHVMIQIGGNVLLCQFHGVKVWSEILLSRVPAIDKDKFLERESCIFNILSTKTTIWQHLKKIYETFQHIPNVVDYMKKRWASENVPWRRL